MNEADSIRLQHMLDAARKAIAFSTGYSRSDLDQNEMLALSIVRCIEIVGEAASRVSPDGRKEPSEVPWADIIGMRNRLMHAYFDIDLDIVWNTVQTDLPSLVKVLERILPSRLS